MSHDVNTPITDEQDDVLSSEEVVIIDQDHAQSGLLTGRRPGMRTRGRTTVLAVILPRFD